MAFGRSTDAGAAVAANVEKGVYAAACIASDNDALTGNLSQNEVAGAWNFGLAACIYPHLRVEAVHLVAKDLGIGVVALRKSFWRGSHFCLHDFPEGCSLSGLLCHKEKA